MTARTIDQAQQDVTSTPVGVPFMMRVLQVFLAMAVLSIGISLAGKWAGRTIALAGHSPDRTVHEVVIGNNVLAVPANMIRFEAARRSGVAERLDLYMRWPDMDGYSETARDDFNHANGSRNILFVSFDEPMMSRDMSGRLEPIYRSLIEAEARPGPAGLAVHAFKPGAGYVDEVLVVGERSGAAPFVARCLAGEAARDSLAPCERDIHLGNALNLTYRMPAELAGQWREIDAAVMKAAADMLETQR